MTPVFQEVTQADYESRITRRRWLTDNTFLLDLERPPGFRFRAGQRIQLRFEGETRDYSLIPGDRFDTLTLLIRRIPGGALTTRLGDCPEGTSLHFSGPSGHFVYRPTSRSAVFVATGTGVAPFVAMCREGARGMTLLHGVRRETELYCRSLLQTAAGLYVPCLSGGPAGTSEGIYPGRVTGYLQDRLPPGDYDVYLAGRREMIADAIAVVDERFPSSRVYSEIFF